MLINKACKRQGGATLIEVLVTLLVFSVGLLGISALQAISLKSNHSSYYRSQATFLAYDIGERMRSNRGEAVAGSYDSSTFPASSSSNDVSGSRTKQDLAEWLNTLSETLPSGTGKIGTVNKIATIEIRWDDSRGAIQANNDEIQETEQILTYRTEI